MATLLNTDAQLELGDNRNALMLWRPFDPLAHDLNPDFHLIRFGPIKGRAGKLPRGILFKLLSEFQQQDEKIRMTIGLDCSVTPLRHQRLSLVQTTDLIYPLIDDPYIMGKIACSNVLNDLYAMGISECDNMLMLLGVSCRLSEKERDIVIPLIIRGFKDLAQEAGTTITGGQTVLNPWCMMGGVATTVCEQHKCIMPNNAVTGDVLVLTKPLATLVAIKAYQWLDQPKRWDTIKMVISKEEVIKAYQRSIDIMVRLNKTAARLMHKYNAHGATDITGYGLLGHARNLAACQKNEVSFVIHNLPIINKMVLLEKSCGNLFKLLEGHCAETSGGLLICLPREQAAAYCKDIEKQEGYQAWIIGIVEKGARTAKIIDKPRVIEIPSREKDGELW